MIEILLYWGFIVFFSFTYVNDVKCNAKCWSLWVIKFSQVHSKTKACDNNDDYYDGDCNYNKKKIKEVRKTEDAVHDRPF